MKQKIIGIGLVIFLTGLLLTLTGCENVSKSDYLVDNVEIGDFVNYPVDYSNVGSHIPYNLTSGWRVIDKEGEGETGEVKLVSNGIPLNLRYGLKTYNSGLQNRTENLFTKLKTEEEDIWYYTDSGFDNNTFDMTEIFNTGFEETDNIHALSLQEITKAYNILQGTDYEFEELLYNKDKDVFGYQKEVLDYQEMKKYNENLSEKSKDLLSNGMVYWLGDEIDNEGRADSKIYLVDATGYINTGYNNSTFGIRPVVTIKAGTKINKDNLKDGNSQETAFELKQ